MDSNTLKGFRAGESGALARIYREYSSELRRVLARRGSLADEDLADVLQDVFTRTFSAQVRSSYDGSRAFRPFLHAIARNVLCDWARRKRKEAVLTCDAMDVAHPDSSLYDEDLTTSRLVETLEKLVERMPPELHAVYVERFLREHTQGSAAIALGVSRQTLRTRERRLIEELRRMLRRSGTFELRRVTQRG